MCFVLFLTQRGKLSTFLKVNSSAFVSRIHDRPLTDEAALQLAINATCNLYQANISLSEEIAQVLEHSNTNDLGFLYTLITIGHKILQESCIWLNTTRNRISLESFNIICDSDNLGYLCEQWDTFLLYNTTQAKVDSLKDVMLSGRHLAREVNEGRWLSTLVQQNGFHLHNMSVTEI